ncbi:mitochondrial protein Pet127-domain-containing protein [Entophlyctis helioformis]|nr:mitochondrial protein Pet127-domain-containing protein [Entophlyctis helioformis]
MSDSEKSRPNGSESTRSQTSLRGPRTTDPVLHELLPAHFNYTSLNQAESELAPRLAHGLERVLFSPGPVLMRDPRTRTFNFSNDIYRIPNPKSFDFSRLSSYVTASEDKVLQGMALEHGQKYYASTSSITTVLSKIILAISGMRPLNLDRLTMPFMSQSAAQTTSSRGPTGVILRYNDGVYGVDMYKRGDSPTVLMELGRVVEKMLCTDTPIFKSYLNNGIGLDELNKDQPDVFHFAKAEGFLLRAQIDCQHPALPGKTFDLKTRATLAIRMDQENYESNLGYRLRKLTGLYESFEREYYDMLRSALLKYSLQVRIGNMDGIFVCYHNTAEMFGFQYVPLEDMDHDLFGNSVFAQQCFAGSLQLLRRVFDAATLEFPGRDVKLMFSAPKEQKLGCYVLAKKEGAQLDVWDESKILKFTIETRSIINGFEVNGLPFVQDIETDRGDSSTRSQQAQPRRRSIGNSTKDTPRLQPAPTWTFSSATSVAIPRLKMTTVLTRKTRTKVKALQWTMLTR